MTPFLYLFIFKKFFSGFRVGVVSDLRHPSDSVLNLTEDLLYSLLNILRAGLRGSPFIRHSLSNASKKGSGVLQTRM